MDIIRKDNPVVIDKSFDVWHILGIAIMLDPKGPYILNCEFAPVRDTGETLTETTVDNEGNETEIPVLAADGSDRILWEVHPTERKRLNINDLNQWIREKIASGDTRPAQAVVLLQTLLTEAAVERGIIDVKTEEDNEE